ncbi:Phage gp6-like head-tail connector protein [Roseovarius albus]|uniref:Phage gp6-like head-tail connector protein n=1 Tax=Roseovarius albus TaxID=1247867 RepID=A0A1X6ZAF2_9RHOB|nr:head-tail connector protein [Roseovarius albus]SLN46114.1 Phage gp6-like head-tail connector protein [Roseovarius albus]
MMLIEETAVSQAALPLAEFKAHLRLGTGFDDDTLQDAVLESFLRAALAAIEARTGKALIARGFSWTVTRWRDQAGQALPIAPVSAVTALKLRSQTDEEEVIDPALYLLEADMQRPILRPRGTLLPMIPEGGVAEVVLTAGYGPTWGDLPADLAQAVLLLAAHYYEYRDETALGGGCMPFGVTSLIERYRTVRLFAGGAAR